MKKVYSIVLLIFGIYYSGHAQSTCGNADFEDGNLNNWTGYTGTCCPIFTSFSGIVPGRHTLTSGPGTDPITNNAVKVVAPDGGLYSARLGNSSVGAEAEKMTFSFTVDANSTLFIYRYAVVFEDPGHGSIDQPRFQLQVFDANNQLINCGEYDVVAGPAVDGFVPINGGSIVYKDWTTVGVDLTPYFNTTVTIEFSTGDCAQTGHFGYAYLDCFYSAMTISSDFCPGSNTTTLSAPEGFASYLWSTGATTPSITISSPQVGASYSCTLTAVTQCSVTLTTVLSPTIVSAAIGTASLCQNEVEFRDQSTVLSGTDINGWQWNFGDGSPADTSQNPVHAYPSPGNYQVQLIVTNQGGCGDTVTIPVTVDSLPIISFNTAPLCAGDTMNFTSTTVATSAPLSQWYWNFGDGSAVDSGSVANHVFLTPGTFSVELVVLDTNGCSDTLIMPISTTPGPDAGFTYASICGTTNIQFTDTTVAANTTITQIIWDFGDGSPLLTGTQPNPLHQYPTYGVYTVTQWVTTATGCIDSMQMQIAVPARIEAGFLPSPLLCATNWATFTDTSIVTDGSTIINWQWDFGDNSPVQGGPNPMHNYTLPGTYTVQLVITASNSCTDTARTQVNVIASPEAQFSLSEVCPGSEAVVSSTLTPAGSPIINETWNFGDGGGDIPGPVTNHTFYIPGSYTVTLYIEDSNGCYDSSQSVVNTAPIPMASFFSPVGCSGQSVLFNSASTVSTGTIDTCLWDFGDGSAQVTAVNTQHIFNTPGTYFVTHIVISDNTCRDTVVNELIIAESPSADFILDSACAGGMITCTDITINNNGFLSNWEWSPVSVFPGSIGQTVVQNVVNNDGPLTVQLVVTNSAGCTDTAEKTTLVYSSPSPDFTFNDVCEGTITAFGNTSQIPVGPAFAWNWDYGDGSTSSQFVSDHLYSGWGNYPVTLTVYDSSLSGCSKSILKNAIVHANPLVAVNTVPPYCAIYEVNLLDGTVVPDGSPIQSWSWDLGNGQISGLQNPVGIYSVPGNYDVSLNVVTIHGCTGSAYLPAFITVFPELKADFDFSPKNASVYQPEVFFYNASIGADTYSWTFGNEDSSSEENPVHIFQASGDIRVQLVVTSAYGCRDTIVKTVEIRPDYSLFVPNAFTPNNDGKNEDFSPKAFNIFDYEMKIIDRWSQGVFVTNDLEKGWDGRFQGKDAPEDVYVYIITFRDVFNKKRQKTGKFSLVR